MIGVRERRLVFAVLALLLLAVAADRPPLVTVAVDARVAERMPGAAQAELDLGALGVVVLGWTARKLAPR